MPVCHKKMRSTNSREEKGTRQAGSNGKTTQVHSSAEHLHRLQAVSQAVDNIDGVVGQRISSLEGSQGS